jgi:hypothetical protein
MEKFGFKKYIAVFYIFLYIAITFKQISSKSLAQKEHILVLNHLIPAKFKAKNYEL